MAGGEYNDLVAWSRTSGPHASYMARLTPLPRSFKIIQRTFVYFPREENPALVELTINLLWLKLLLTPSDGENLAVATPLV